MGNCSNPCQCNKESKEAQVNKHLQTIKTTQEFKAQKAITEPKQMFLPLRTDRSKIVDSLGRRVKLCCYNLKGCHSNKGCVSLIQRFTIQELAKQIRQKGFNTVIIPFSLDLYFQNPRIQSDSLGPNIWMNGKNALQVLDITVNGLTSKGLLVILRNACSKATSFREFTQSDGLWWSQKYSQSKWIECLSNMSQRYSHNPRMIAIQIRHTLKKTSNHQPKWGFGGVLCDWKRAATLACDEILSKNDNILAMIPGIDRGDFKKIQKSPLILTQKNRLVFVSKLKHQAQRIKNYERLAQHIEQDLNCIRRTGYPLILTTITDHKQSDWKLIVKYLQQSDMDWGYSAYPKSLQKGSEVRQLTENILSNQKILGYLRKIQVSTVQGPQQLNSLNCKQSTISNDQKTVQNRLRYY